MTGGVLLRRCVGFAVVPLFMVRALMDLHSASGHDAAAMAAQDPPPAAGQVAAPDSGTPEAYSPWGITRKDPETHRVMEPKVLARDASGQFHVNVLVNGHDTRFLVDTGADLVALTPQTARDVGLAVADGDYQPVLRTASGTGMGAPVWLDSVEVVGRHLTRQRAVVAQGLGENLLGQSVLRSLGRVQLQGDTLVLSP